MKNIKIIIGANYGDEGKGLMTDYFAAETKNKNENCVVVLCNGGAQRGHTVTTSDGHSHVFHHFGSGTFTDAVTYCSEDFIVNPLIFVDERKSFSAFFPKFFLHPNCPFSTPYDMIANQIIEESRGKNKHGSTGNGIWETICRYKNNYGISICNFLDFSVNEKINHLLDIKSYYEKRLIEENVDFMKINKDWKNIFNSENIINAFLYNVEEMRKYIVFSGISLLNSFDNIIFEMGQGLMLDENIVGKSVHTTPSHTGIKNPMKIIQELGLKENDIEVVYVTRTYLTRHGAGPLPNECNSKEINEKIFDETNIYNPSQEYIRYAKMSENDFKKIKERIKKDIGNSNYKYSLAITHLNEYNFPVDINKEKEFYHIYLSNGKTREKMQII